LTPQGYSGKTAVAAIMTKWRRVRWYNMAGLVSYRSHGSAEWGATVPARPLLAVIGDCRAVTSGCETICGACHTRAASSGCGKPKGLLGRQ